MRPVVQADNRRESYRIPVDAPQQAARLRAGGVWTEVQVLDESRGGFGVLVPALDGMAVGQLVQLRTASECCELEVVHVTECPATGEGTPPALRLGLKRVREIFLNEVERAPWYQRFRVPWQRSSWEMGRTVGMAGFLFALIIGVVPIVVIILMERREIRDVEIGSPTIGERDETWLSRFEAPKARPTRKPASPTATVPKQNNVDVPSPPLRDRRHEDWPRLVDKAKRQVDLGAWKDSLLATIARLVDRVTLTPKQQTQVAEVLQRANEALAQATAPNTSTTADPIAERRATVLEAAYTELMKLLTDAQKVQWADLVRGTDGVATPKK